MLLLCLLALFSPLQAARIPEKALICGVCKDVEKAVFNDIASMTKAGKLFLDYRVIIYENNSRDKTKELLQNWADQDKKVIFISENLSRKELAALTQMKALRRTELIAYARNRVLDIALDPAYDDYKYIIWADLDFVHPWDIEAIAQTILNPEQKEWDAVLAAGSYDLFAFRDKTFPIGFELLGKQWWNRLNEIRPRIAFNKETSWRKVLSAFGGLGIYQREAVKGCRYFGVVTKDLEKVVEKTLEEARKASDVCFLKEYEQLLQKAKIVQVEGERIENRKALPSEIGVKLQNHLGEGKVVWFSCTRKESLPWTCEHIPFHASMIVRGRDKIFINPKLSSPNGD